MRTTPYKITYKGLKQSVRCAGVYLLFADDVCVYVGMSRTDVNKRVLRFIGEKHTCYNDKFQRCLEDARNIEIVVLYRDTAEDAVRDELLFIRDYNPNFGRRDSYRKIHSTVWENINC